MVRFLTLALAAIAALAPTHAADVIDLPKGQPYRPSGSQVSGRVDATTLYVRSPCPALNALANHGYIPRDGKNLSGPLLKAAVMEYFNIAEDLADVMVSLSPNTSSFSLATLSTHNLIEHDVSLSRRDVYFGVDESVADPTYLVLLLQPSVEGVISLRDVARIRAARAVECKTTNPECDYGDQQQFIANAESALLLRAMGANNTEVAPFNNIYSFFMNEQFPTGFVKSKEPITFADVSSTIDKLKIVQSSA